jgi:hypothetical protein
MNMPAIATGTAGRASDRSRDTATGDCTFDMGGGSFPRCPQR